jgi:hypothetical protein
VSRGDLVIPLVRITSFPAVRLLATNVSFGSDSVEEPLQPNEGKERGDDDQYWGHCHVWMSPADQGLFFGVALIVGAVMSSALCAENLIRWP